MNTAIHSIASYLPTKVITNAHLEQSCGIDNLFLEKKIGIQERRVAAEEETTSVMATWAAKRLLSLNGKSASDIDLLIVCTQNPDYRLPTTACLVQSNLGCKTSCAAFDINLGCSGYVYALAIADSFIKAGYSRHALLIMAEQYSRLIDPKDKNTVSLFGDAAAASWVSSCRDDAGIIDVDLNTDGLGATHLIAYNSGVKRDAEKPESLCMNGREIFRFAITMAPESVHRVLKRNKLTVADIKSFVFHQANQYILSELQKLLGIREDQMIIDMALTGNTVSASIPLILETQWRNRTFESGDRLILCGFGVGLSWGSILYVMP